MALLMTLGSTWWRRVSLNAGPPTVAGGKQVLPTPPSDVGDFRESGVRQVDLPVAPAQGSCEKIRRARLLPSRVAATLDQERLGRQPRPPRQGSAQFFPQPQVLLVEGLDFGEMIFKERGHADGEGGDSSLSPLPDLTMTCFIPKSTSWILRAYCLHDSQAAA